MIPHQQLIKSTTTDEPKTDTLNSGSLRKRRLSSPVEFRCQKLMAIINDATVAPEL